MKVSIIDFETSSVDPKTCEPIQFGFVNLVCEGRKIHVVSEGSFLIRTSEAIENSDIHGITDEVASCYGVSLAEASQRIASTLFSTDVIVGHNVLAFDRIVLERVLGSGVGKTLYFDTMVDWPYQNVDSMKLKYLCLDNGYVHQNSHSALGDCHAVLSLLRTLAREFDLPSFIGTSSLSPYVRLVAKVSFQDRNLAKDHGFRWSPERKIWSKVCRTHAFQYPFEVEHESV